jgi:hypothetical protein
MKDLSLEITLEDGRKQVFPLSYRATEHYRGAFFSHESQVLCMSGIEDIRLDQFTNHKNTWELVDYFYVEGLATKGELDHPENEEYGISALFSWQILLNGKPASHAEVEEDLNGCKTQTINSAKLTWMIFPCESFSDCVETYCADGDGIVSIHKRLSGVYYATCEFSEDIQGIYATLEEALAKGEALLLEYYPEVYEEAMHWNDEPTTEEQRLAFNATAGYGHLD